MHSRVEIAVDAGDSGTTRFTRLAAEGGLAVRQTSASGVHLIGTAAGPIGDDLIDIAISVGRGAHLTLHGVAATICLPGTNHEASQLTLTIMLHSDASLECALPTLIVCRGSRISSTTEVAAEGSSTLILDEQVSLGRSGEDGGEWSNRTVVDVQGRPALRQTQTSASVLDAVSRLAGERLTAGAIVSRLALGPVDDDGIATTSGGAMRLRLPVAGRLSTSVGRDLLHAHRDLATLGAADSRLDAAGTVAD